MIPPALLAIMERVIAAAMKNETTAAPPVLERIAAALERSAAALETANDLARYPLVSDRPKYGPHSTPPPLDDFPPVPP